MNLRKYFGKIGHRIFSRKSYCCILLKYLILCYQPFNYMFLLSHKCHKEVEAQIFASKLRNVIDFSFLNFAIYVIFIRIIKAGSFSHFSYSPFELEWNFMCIWTSTVYFPLRVDCLTVLIMIRLHYYVNKRRWHVFEFFRFFLLLLKPAQKDLSVDVVNFHESAFKLNKAINLIIIMELLWEPLPSPPPPQKKKNDNNLFGLTYCIRF